MTIYWAPLLHVYQPPWQDVEILKQIYDDCYKPLLSMMERHNNVKITLNIQGCLLDQLKKLNLQEAYETTQNLLAQQKVQLVGSGKYHPILPLIPKREIQRQINSNKETLCTFFPITELKGFFPPEMAISMPLTSLLRELGYQWVIVDGIANNAKWPYDRIQQLPSGLAIIYRDTFLSNDISFKSIDAHEFVERIKNLYGDATQQDYYIVTAQDAETFGHHIPFYETSFLGKVFSLIEDDPAIEACFISDLFKKFPTTPIQKIKASSWSTSAENLKANIPYPLWQHPMNTIHKFQYRMLRALHHLMTIVEEKYLNNGKNASFIRYYHTARYFYDQAMHSCWLWWGAGVEHLPGFWSPNLIYKGMDLVIQTALNAQLALINIKIGTGEEFYSRIISNSEKLMNEMIEQEARGQKLRTYGDDFSPEIEGDGS